ncbi:MAG: hypothetical protein Q8R82_14915 [Hyphomonadaceae bacterium]|nr:hypothetical protein [Hyphomonadaceae bacterium]
MFWRVWIAGAFAAMACAAANAQTPLLAPVVTHHTIDLREGPLAYTATAGLMPILAPSGEPIGDMSYIAYTATPRQGKTRPIAFIWNGGSGANSTPLHYGAFGPRRLAAGKMATNVASLLDAADLVFIDQIETGFGRYAAGVDQTVYLNQRADADTFAQFIQGWLQAHGGIERPTFLIGESYGVRRAQVVTENLLKRGILPEALVLISGYSLVGEQLDPAIEGAFRLPGYSAFAFRRGELKDTSLQSENDAHDAALTWARALAERIEKSDIAGRQIFSDGLKRFLGFSDERIADTASSLSPQSTIASLSELSQRHATMIFADVWNPISYDLRNWKSDNREWISQAIVDDIRDNLQFNPSGRVYVGQEYDHAASRLAASLQQPMKIHRADGTSVELSRETLSKFPELYGAFSRLNALLGRQPPAARPADGLAETIVNFNAHFNAALSLRDSPMPELMTAAPDLKLFIAGGMYDDLLPCAVGAEMARRDLVAFSGRVLSKCYAGGHMMYDDEPQSVALSEDVRSFIRNVLAAHNEAGVTATP